MKGTLTMKSTKIACAIAAAALGFSSLSFGQASNFDAAQQQEQQRARGGSGWQPQQRGEVRRDGRDYNRGDRRDYNRGDRRDYGRDYGRTDQYYYNARGPEWRRGGYVPYQYRSNQYVVNDWRGHRLHAPPRGYHWVQVGSDYVLVAIATGVILELLINQ